MKRRKFLQSTSLMPFLASSLFVAEAKAEANQNNMSPFKANDNDTRDFFYRPANAWAADFIPLYANGEFQLFYLLDWRDKEKFGEGTPWYRISTKDFVNFKEHGEVLTRGTLQEQDLYVFTGSAINANGKYHIFYTGHNPHLRQQGKPEQGVMHATSNDMIYWNKIPKDTFFAPPALYEKNDWRDPFVFWNEEAKEYYMLLAARHNNGIPRRRGLTALCTSKDLINWTVKDPFYDPQLFYTHECPDLFKMGDWWYLVFSEFTDLVRTRYRMSRSISGPWLTPARDDFDGHAFYAAKTASDDGNRRFIFGWNPTREGETDHGFWNWGGNLVVHEIIQQGDGQLAVRVPDTVDDAFSKAAPFSFAKGAGRFSSNDSSATIDASGTFGAASAGKMPPQCKIDCTVVFDKDVTQCGLMFRTSHDLDSSYYICLNTQTNKLVFDMWPRYRADVNHLVELDRGIKLMPGTPVKMKLFIDGTKGVVYVDDLIAMNFRAYDLPAGNWGVFAIDGTATFTNMKVSVM